MEANWSPLIIGLAAFILGWVIGFFDSNLRTSKKIKAAGIQAEIQIEEARKKFGDTGSKPVGNSLLRLWTDSAQNFKVDLDNIPVIPDGLTATQRSRLIALVRQMSPWLESGIPPSPALPIEPAKASQDSKTIPPPTTLRPILTAATTTPPSNPGKPAVSSHSNMIDQINDVLQKKLVGTTLAGKGIRIQESLSGTLWIYVGLKRYEGIDAVPDDQIKVIIRQAVTDWEKRG